MAIVTYVGWIPTILGRLSFTKIGSTSQAGNTKRYPVGTNRFFVVCQIRWTTDALFAWIRKKFSLSLNWILRNIRIVEFPYEIGEFSYYLVAEKSSNSSEDKRTLTGYIISLPSKRDGLNADIFKTTTSGKETDEETPLVLSLDGVLDLVSKYNESIKDKDNLRIPERAATMFSFVLERDGIVELTFVNNYPRDLASDEIESLAEQAFFFIKDISHVHQHHSESSDSPFRLHRKNTDTNDTTKWAHEIHRELQRAVVTNRRMKSDCDMMLDAVGIACYMESFVKIAKKRDIELTDLNYELLRQSVDISNHRVDTTGIRSERYYSRWVAFLGLFIALCASYHLMSAAQPIVILLVLLVLGSRLLNCKVYKLC